MAEYIDRGLIEWYGCNFEEPSCKNRECSGCSHAECSHSQVMQIPPADVIERSKIDKAIEEIENEIKFWDCPVNYQEPLEVQRNKQAKANSYRHALEILKRNIGE